MANWNAKNHLETLAEYLVSIKNSALPVTVKTAARACCVDTLAAAIGGSDYEEVPCIIKTFLTYSGTYDKNTACASIWGSSITTSVFQAAFLNGILSHSLELDDVHTGSKSHIGAVVLPAAWSVAEAIGAGGEKLLEAVVAGYEAMSRIGRGFGVAAHRMKGWHVSGTAGTFGAAAAAAKLLELNVGETLSAFGLAGTQSSGLWAFLEDGATSKKLHTGRAAESGVTAAFLAKSGMTGPPHILDAQDGGLYRATSDAFDVSAVSRDLGTVYEILQVDRKPYSCCRSMHPALDAILAVRNEKKTYPEEIEHISIRSYEVGVKQCGVIKYPVNASEAKFSMRFGVAAAYIDGAAGQKQFSKERIADPKIRELAAKIDYAADETFTSRYPQNWGCSLTVVFRDGTRIEKMVMNPSGSVAEPMSEAQLDQKFSGLVSPFLGAEKAEAMLKSLKNLETFSNLSGLSMKA
jgi:2-methylcitrate dehydratase PrpD